MYEALRIYWPGFRDSEEGELCRGVEVGGRRVECSGGDQDALISPSPYFCLYPKGTEHLLQLLLIL